MAELILRLDDESEMVLNGEVDESIVESFRYCVEFDEDTLLSTDRSWWTINTEGRSNSSDVYEYLRERVYNLLSGGCMSVISESWRRSTAGLILAQLAHVHGMAPLLPRDEERATR